MPEMPLTLRLIGLRVTKLKDLRVESEKKASGIKRVRPPSTRQYAIAYCIHSSFMTVLPICQRDIST